MTNQSNKSELSNSERDAFATVGRIGGKTTVRKHGKGYMSKLGKKGADARWKPKSKTK